MKLSKLDNYFKLAHVVAENSPDFETKVGCILVGQEGEIMLSSYNGFIKGAPDAQLPKTRPAKYDYIQHAEVNAIYQAAGSSTNIKGCIAISTLSPCSNCMRALYQSNIHTIYFEEEYRDFQKHIQMKDLNVKLTKIKNYTKIDLEPQKEE